VPAKGKYKPYRHEYLRAAVLREMNITEICKKIKMSRKTFYSALNGSRVMSERVTVIAEALDVPIEKVFDK